MADGRSVWCRLGLHCWGRVAYTATQFYPASRIQPPPTHTLDLEECQREGCGAVRRA